MCGVCSRRVHDVLRWALAVFYASACCVVPPCRGPCAPMLWAWCHDAVGLCHLGVGFAWAPRRRELGTSPRRGVGRRTHLEDTLLLGSLPPPPRLLSAGRVLEDTLLLPTPCNHRQCCSCLAAALQLRLSCRRHCSCFSACSMCAATHCSQPPRHYQSRGYGGAAP